MAPKPHGGGNPAKINAERLAVVEQLQKQSPDALLEELCEQLWQKEGVRVSPTTISRALQKLKWSRKKTFHADEQERPVVQQERTEYRQKVADVDPEQLIFIDEMGSNLALARLYARAPQGQRAYASKPLNRGVNVTTIGALGLGEIKAVMTVEGGVDGEVFRIYVEQVLVPQLEPGQVVVMDNLKAHKVQGIEEAIEKVGARVVYLSPYSPDFSPIELCWAKLKAFLRAKAARTREALDQAITETLQTITAQDALGWFAHCGYCTSAN